MRSLLNGLVRVRNRSGRWSTTAVVAVALACFGCRGLGGPSWQRSAGRIVSLEKSVDPLEDWFNDNRGFCRVIAILSPTSDMTPIGERALREGVLEGFPDADVRVAIVWTDRLPTDNADVAAESARKCTDFRVTHFHDSRHGPATGAVFASGRMDKRAGPAWQMFLVFDRAARWVDVPPDATAWFHQLGGGVHARPSHFRTGRHLEDSLYQSVQECLGKGG